MHAELKTLDVHPIRSNAVRPVTVSAGISFAIVNSTVSMEVMRNVQQTQNAQLNHSNANKAVHAFHELPFAMADHNVHMAKMN